MPNFYHKFRIVFFVLIACSLGFHCAWAFSETSRCIKKEDKLVFLLKLDDVVGVETAELGVSEKWVKIAKYLEDNKVPASFGIIGESLERENKRYFAWLKDRDRRGYIEFWNHGYAFKYPVGKNTGNLGEFNGADSEDQKRALSRTQALAKSKIGIVLRGFGPHFSALDDSSFDQIDSVNEIDYVWFYKPVDQRKHRPFVFKRLAELEAPIFKPNFEAFLKTFQRADKSNGYIALQGHPNEWDDKGFEAFFRIVEWIMSQGGVFCRPSDFLSGLL